MDWYFAWTKGVGRDPFRSTIPQTLVVSRLGLFYVRGDMPRLVNRRGYGVRGIGMPDMVTPKGKKAQIALDNRIERLLAEDKKRVAQRVK